jgi:hypothetical protein
MDNKVVSPDWRPLVEEIQTQINLIDRQIAAFDIADKDEVAEFVSALHALKAEMSVVYDSACAVLVRSMKSVPEMVLSDGTKIEKRAASDRKKWQHDALAKNVASRIGDMAVDMETGEVVLTPQDMMVKMLDYCAPSYWRVKELAKIGINADKFCDVSESKESIIVRRAK